MAEIRNIREFGKEVENIVFKIQDAVCIMHSNLNLNQITYSSFISVFKYCGYNNEEDVNVGYYKKAIGILDKYCIDLSYELEWYEMDMMTEYPLLFLQRIIDNAKEKCNVISQPNEITKLFLEVADIKDSDRVYNPFAGICSIGIDKNECLIDAEENDEEVWALATLYHFAFKTRTHVDLCDSIDAFENSRVYDKIIFHPPFLEEGKEGNAVIKCLNNKLVRGGRLVCLLPGEFMYALHGGLSDLFDYLMEKRYETQVIALPPRLLSPSTSINLCMLIVDKKRTDKLSVMDATESYLPAQGGKYIFDFDKYLLESQLVEKYNEKWSELEEYDITPSMFEAKKHYDDYRMERLDFVTNIEGDEKDEYLQTLVENKYNEFTNSYEVEDIYHWDGEGASTDPFAERINVINVISICDADKYYRDMNGTYIGIKATANGIKIAELYFEGRTNVAYKNNEFFLKIWNEDEIDKDYLKMILTSDYVNKQLNAILKKNYSIVKAGSTIRYEFSSIDISYIKSIIIPVPSLEKQKELVNEYLQKRLEEKKEIAQATTEEYKKQVHCRKHAMSQTVCGLSSLWNILSSYKKDNEGALNDSDMIGEVNQFAVGELWERMSGQIKILRQQLEHIADEDEDWGETEDIDVKQFINEYISSHEKSEYKYTEPIFNEDNYNEIGTISIPKAALVHVFDNIISNSEEHGFTDSDRSDYKICVVADAEENGCTIRIMNNGTPMSPEIEEKNLYYYGYSTALNELSGKSDGHRHSGIGLYEVQQILNKYGASVTTKMYGENDEYTVETIINFTDNE